MSSARDLALTGIGRLVTNDPGRAGPLGTIDHATVIVEHGRVVWAGSADERPLPGGLPVLDCGGRLVLPGFVDCHTHLIFGGDREDEFRRRLAGERYEDLLEAGGGIRATVRATRRAPPDELAASASQRLERMLGHGTTTVEVKSGYGLDVETERRMLAVAAELDRSSRVDVMPTFMGAHVVPSEYGSDRSAYVRLVIDEMLPAVAGLARFCDVFCDRGAFTVEEARSILQAGSRHGLRPRLHAGQLGPGGGVALAAELRAASVDHVDHVTEEDVVALAGAETVAVMLPAVALSMRIPQPPARRLLDAGVTLALATDCNPGTAYVESMPLVVALGILETGLTVEEAIRAATRGGAAALDLDDRGWIGTGARADMQILDAGSEAALAYRPGTDLVWKVVKDGQVVVDRS